MIKIAPSLLAADMGDLRRAVAQVEAAGADYLHLDVMDGAFVPNISYGPAVIKALRPNSQLFFDVHLMVEEPGRFLSDYAAAGADLLTVHFEACRHLHRVVQQIKALGLKAGVALNPATPPEVLQDILPELDLVLIERQPWFWRAVLYSGCSWQNCSHGGNATTDWFSSRFGSGRRHLCGQCRPGYAGWR